MDLFHDNRVKLALAVALLGLSGALTWRSIQSDATPSEQSFFYDQSAKKLFPARRDLIPPARGIDDAAEDAVRAVVVSTNGRPQQRSTWRIAYLETNTPELKQQFKTARSNRTALAMGRGAAQDHRWVKRPEDTAWVPLSTPEGERIVTEWTSWGSGDTTPVVCSP